LILQDLHSPKMVSRIMWFRECRSFAAVRAVGSLAPLGCFIALPKHPWSSDFFMRTLFPELYHFDGDGWRVLTGLTIEETAEFKALDGLPPLDDSGGHVAWEFDGRLSNSREKRWLELYLKHDEACKALAVKAFERHAQRCEPLSPLQEHKRCSPSETRETALEQIFAVKAGRDS
jgi:hypothetical protein